jgi:membrane protein DedA with SNARE-associated domain
MTDAIGWIIETFGYAGVTLLTLAETVFPPLPSEVIIPLAGLEAQQRGLSLAGVVIAGTIGSMTGNFLWYWLALRLGLSRFKPLVDRYGRWLTAEWREIERAERYFARHAALFVFLGRLLPAIRTFISVPAGFARMKLLSYLFWSALGTSLWTAALAWAGWVAGQNLEKIQGVLGPLTIGIFVFFAGWYLWRLLRSFLPAAR